jgi:hypothetical protein
MLRLSRILALLATIMLVIGGSPAVAASQPCNPCPPDCAMMKQMAADHHGKTPDKGGQPDNPCKPGLACQASVSVTAPSVAASFAILTTTRVDHGGRDQLAASSRPPDRSLRPPIQL